MISQNEQISWEKHFNILSSLLLWGKNLKKIAPQVVTKTSLPNGIGVIVAQLLPVPSNVAHTVRRTRIIPSFLPPLNQFLIAKNGQICVGDWRSGGSTASPPFE